MTDFEAFQAALRRNEDDEMRGDGGRGGSGYMGNLLNSMSLMLEEFYKHLSLVGVSAMAGTGIDDFLQAVQDKVEEYNTEYKPELESLRQKRELEKSQNQQKELDKLMKDMDADPSSTSSNSKHKDSSSETNKPIQVDVLSDIESDEDSNAGELIERDEDEALREGDGEKDIEEGLQARYQKALEEDKTKKGSTLDEDSFMRYLMANQ